MRRLILALSVLGIVAGANAALAGPSTTDRDLLASADPATPASVAAVVAAIAKPVATTVGHHWRVAATSLVYLPCL